MIAERFAIAPSCPTAGGALARKESVLLRRSVLLAAAALTVLAPVRGWTATPGDPFEKFNRKSFIVTLAVERYLLRPFAKLYRALTPGPIGKGLHNLLTNLKEPVAIANCLLQGRPKAAIAATVRLSINSTFGIAGLIDVTAKGDPHVDNGFGDTLGVWGVKPGPYLFVPFFGPADVRDLVGTGMDSAADPLHFLKYPYRTTVSVTRGVAGAFDSQSTQIAQLEALFSQAADPYATLRSVYLQQREAKIASFKGGEQALPPLPPLPDLGAEPPIPAQPEAAPPEAAPSPAEPETTAPPTPAPPEQPTPQP